MTPTKTTVVCALQKDSMGEASMNKTVACVVLVLVAIMAFWAGSKVSFATKISPALEVQATVAYGNYDALDKINNDLARGCVARAQSRIEFLADQQKMLLADYIQNWDDPKFESYISLRNAPLLKELKRNDFVWNSDVVLPDCEK